MYPYELDHIDESLHPHPTRPPPFDVARATQEQNNPRCTKFFAIGALIQIAQPSAAIRADARPDT